MWRWMMDEATSIAARWGTVAAVAVLVAAAVVHAGPAFAGVAGTDGPGGTVTVGASDGGSSPGSPAGGAGGGSGGGSTGGSPWVCISTSLLLNDVGGFAPGGPTPGGWYSVTCIDNATGAATTRTEWIPDLSAVATAPAVDPRQVALQAENSLHLPVPSLYFNPSGPSVVNLPTWLWIDPSVWRQYSVTASVGTVSATAVATPESVTWEMGDGRVVLCVGPGHPFEVGLPASGQGTACMFTYRTSSIGQPSPDGNPDDAAYRVRATITWDVSWTAQGAPGQGILPTLTTSAEASLRVVQVESVNSGSFGPSDLRIPMEGIPT